MITLTPAYGRDYKSKREVIEALGKSDFIIQAYGHPYDGKPCSPTSDLAGQRVQVRYAGLRKVFIHKL